MTRRGWLVRIGFSAALLVLVWSSSARAAAPNQETAIRLDPPTLEMKAGETAKVQVRVESAEGVYGYQFALLFDPAQVEVVDADPTREGVQVDQGEFLSGESFVAINRADNEAGRIQYVATLLGPVQGKTGGGALATVTVRAKQGGELSLRLSDVKLAGTDSHPVPITVEGGEVAAPPPYPSSPQKAAALPAIVAAPTIAGASAPARAAPTPAPQPRAPAAQPAPQVRAAPTPSPAPQAATASPLVGILGAVAVVVAIGALAGSYLRGRRNGGRQ